MATSLAFIICLFLYYTVWRYRTGGPDGHMGLALCQCLLATYSQFALNAVLCATRKTYRNPISFRFFITGLEVVPTAWIGEASVYVFGHTGFARLTAYGTAINAVGIYLLLALMTVLSKSMKHDELTLRMRRTFTAITIYSLIWMIIILSCMLYIKYHGLGGCDLNTPGDDQWTLGQLFVVVMLVAPIMSFVETFASKIYTLKQNIRSLTGYRVYTRIRS